MAIAELPLVTRLAKMEQGFKFYAGIGSRETPPSILSDMERIAAYLEKQHWILRSGGASGADSAFEKGVGDPRMMEIFRPWGKSEGNHIVLPHFKAEGWDGQRFTQIRHFEDELSAKVLADILIAAGDRRHAENISNKSSTLALWQRNWHQVFGANGTTPSSFIICWTKNGEEKGGTACAIRLAKSAKIPVFNLAIQANYNRIMAKIKE